MHEPSNNQLAGWVALVCTSVCMVGPASAGKLSMLHMHKEAACIVYDWSCLIASWCNSQFVVVDDVLNIKEAHIQKTCKLASISILQAMYLQDKRHTDNSALRAEVDGQPRQGLAVGPAGQSPQAHDTQSPTAGQSSRPAYSRRGQASRARLHNVSRRCNRVTKGLDVAICMDMTGSMVRS